jgi:hypothetical protein
MKLARTLLIIIVVASNAPRAMAHETPEQLARAAAAYDAPVSGQLPEESPRVEAAAPQSALATEPADIAEGPPPVVGNERAERPARVTDSERVEKAAENSVAPKESAARGAVVAMDARQGRPVRAGELVTAGAEPWLLVGRKNQRIELAPRAVAELDEHGALRLLRGSAMIDSRDEYSVRTPAARVDFVGKVLVSYDHAEKSSSAFVLEGEGRLVNAHRQDSSVRLQRFRGATLVAGEVLPQLVRQLDVGALDTWLKGYSWPEERRKGFLKEMPSRSVASTDEGPKHLRDAKIEDYFSSIDTADEFHQPDYYERKFDDPDKVVAEQNSMQGGHKALTPEEAALISLPKTQIDLGFELGPEFLSSDQKSKEVRQISQDPPPRRAPASATVRKVVKTRKVAAEPVGDPDVNLVLERLRRVKSGNPAISGLPAPGARNPSSVPAPVVPDPVYDYSQNF